MSTLDYEGNPVPFLTHDRDYPPTYHCRCGKESHPQSDYRLCAEHELEEWLEEMHDRPFDMEVQAEVAAWRRRVEG